MKVFGLVLIGLILVGLCIYVISRKKESGVAKDLVEASGEDFSCKIIVQIEGMHCVHCAARVEEVFAEFGALAKVNLDTKQVQVLSHESLDETEVKNRILELGFSVSDYAVIL